MEFDCGICIHKKVCDLWTSQESQDASCFCRDGCDYFMPTITPPNEWVSMDERLPKKDGWYLVYAPGYWGNSKIYGLDGLSYSNFKHNYKVHWGIERGTGRGWPGIVTHWMPLPVPPDRRQPEGE